MSIVKKISVGGVVYDIQDQREFADVALSGDYDDLENTPTIPTKTSDLTNDSGFITNSYHDSSKQDVLTAGSNISISSGTISATDTTYSNATSSAAGLMSAADKTKLDGVAASASAVSVSSTGTATDEVQYITVNGVEKKLAGGSSVEIDNQTIKTNAQGKLVTAIGGYTETGTTVQIVNGPLVDTYSTGMYSAATGSLTSIPTTGNVVFKIKGEIGPDWVTDTYTDFTFSATPTGWSYLGASFSINVYGTAAASPNTINVQGIGTGKTVNIDMIYSGSIVHMIDAQYVPNVLTAGSNIWFSGNQINANSTTYSGTNGISVDPMMHNISAKIDNSSIILNDEGYMKTAVGGGVTRTGSEYQLCNGMFTQSGDSFTCYGSNIWMIPQSNVTIKMKGEIGDYYVSDSYEPISFTWDSTELQWKYEDTFFGYTIAINSGSRTILPNNIVVTGTGIGYVNLAMKYGDVIETVTKIDSQFIPNILTAGSNITMVGNTISATDTTYSNATTSASGLMSSTDKTKLDGISAGAKAVGVSATGTATDEVQYITIDGVEKKIAGGGGASYSEGVGIDITDNVISADTPVITIAVSQVRQQTPVLIVELTDEQDVIIKSPVNDIKFDLSALGMTSNYFFHKNTQSSSSITGSFVNSGNACYDMEYIFSNKQFSVAIISLQTHLTAGTNITITDNVISATDTTYTAGTGITIDDNNVISASGGSLPAGIAAGTGANSLLLGNATNKTDAGPNDLLIGYASNDSNIHGSLTGNANIVGGYATNEGTIATYGSATGSFVYGVARKNYSAQGYITASNGYANFAFGVGTNGGIVKANDGSWAVGYNDTSGLVTESRGQSFAFGRDVYANNKAFAIGKSNLRDDSSQYAFIIGNGSNADNRSNAEATDWSGNKYISGNIYVGCTDYTTNSSGLVTPNAGGTKLVPVSANPEIATPTTFLDSITINGTNYTVRDNYSIPSEIRTTLKADPGIPDEGAVHALTLSTEEVEGETVRTCLWTAMASVPTVTDQEGTFVLKAEVIYDEETGTYGKTYSWVAE